MLCKKKCINVNCEKKKTVAGKGDLRVVSGTAVQCKNHYFKFIGSASAVQCWHKNWQFSVHDDAS